MVLHWIISGRQIWNDVEIYTRLIEDDGVGAPRVIATNRTTLALTPDEIDSDPLAALLSQLERLAHALSPAQTS